MTTSRDVVERILGAAEALDISRRSAWSAVEALRRASLDDSIALAAHTASERAIVGADIPGHLYRAFESSYYEDGEDDDGPLHCAPWSSWMTVNERRARSNEALQARIRRTT